MATLILRQPQGFFETVDYNCLDLSTSFKDFCHASERGHHEGVGDAVLRHVNAHAWFYYLCLSTLRTVSNAVIAFSEKAPQVFSILQNANFVLGATICGFVTNAITSIQETIGIMRQSSILSIFRQNAYQGNSLTLAEDLETLSQRYTPDELQSRLRPWFMEAHQLDTHDRLTQLAADIRLGKEEAIEEGTELVAQMRSLAIKKLAMHIIGFLAVIISMAGLIGSLVACPPAAIFALLAIGTILWATRTVMLNAYVDNPDGGFSLLRCFPNCIANCFRNDAEPEAVVLE